MTTLSKQVSRGNSANVLQVAGMLDLPLPPLTVLWKDTPKHYFWDEVALRELCQLTNPPKEDIIDGSFDGV